MKPFRMCDRCGAVVEPDAGRCPSCESAIPEQWTETERQRAALQEALGAQFELCDRIGQGQFGIIYRATDWELDRVVAIKVLRRAAFETGFLRDLFLRGARVAAQFEHPGILRVYAVGEANELCWIVQPLVAGESLAALLLREGRLDAGEVARLLGEAAAALHWVHMRGLVHRDIKPQHILLEGPERAVRLIDFGLVGVIGPRLTAPVGTPAYTSPEQAARAGPLDGRSDLYALGVVGYQMLTGQLPFEGTAEDLVRAHREDPPPDPRDRRPDIPGPLAVIVKRCLAKRPEHRWHDMESLRVALQRFSAAAR